MKHRNPNLPGESRASYFAAVIVAVAAVALSITLALLFHELVPGGIRS